MTQYFRPIVIVSRDLQFIGGSTARVSRHRQAEEILQSTRCHQKGSPDLNPLILCQCRYYSTQPVLDYRQPANEQTLCAIGVEGSQEVVKVDESLSIESVDAIFGCLYDFFEFLEVHGRLLIPREVPSPVPKFARSLRAAGIFAILYQQPRHGLTKVFRTFSLCECESMLGCTHSNHNQSAWGGIMGSRKESRRSQTHTTGPESCGKRELRFTFTRIGLG